MFKNFLISFALVLGLFVSNNFVFADSFDAVVDSSGKLTNTSNTIVKDTGIDNSKKVPDLIATAIKITLGFFGAIALFYIIWGGFDWMMSQGDSKKIMTARNRMVTAVIGMLIIATSYAITDFIMSQIAVVAG